MKIDMNTLWDVQLQKWRYQCEYLDKWRELEDQLGKELDAIIAPVTPTAAIRHNQFRYYGYASAINLLDFTSVVVPVTFADKAVDKKKEGYQPLNELDKAVQDECMFFPFLSFPIHSPVSIVFREMLTSSRRPRSVSRCPRGGPDHRTETERGADPCYCRGGWTVAGQLDHALSCI